MCFSFAPSRSYTMILNPSCAWYRSHSSNIAPLAVDFWVSVDVYGMTKHAAKGRWPWFAAEDWMAAPTAAALAAKAAALLANKEALTAPPLLLLLLLLLLPLLVVALLVVALAVVGPPMPSKMLRGVV
jgi:hypothetical protein